MSRMVSALSGIAFSTSCLFVSSNSQAQDAANKSSTLPPVIVKIDPPQHDKRHGVPKKKEKPQATARPAAGSGEGAAGLSGETMAFSPTLQLTPISRIGSSVTVITSQDLEAKQNRTVPDALSDGAGPECGADRRARGRNLCLHARGQLQPHQSACGRHRRQRSNIGNGRLRFRASSHLGHRPDRSSAWPPKRALRIGRHRRGDRHQDETRLRSGADYRQRRRLVRSEHSTRRPASAARPAPSAIRSTPRIFMLTPCR